jgi:membrane associated rhomboid family serine protease
MTMLTYPTLKKPFAYPSPYSFQEPEPDFGGQDPRDPAGQGKRTQPREPIFKSIPKGVGLLIAVIVAIHVGLQLAGPVATQSAIERFGASPRLIEDAFRAGDWSQVFGMLIGHQFLHGGTLHLIMNMAMLLQAGPIAEAGLGRTRGGAFAFIVFFLLCGIGGGVAYVWANPGSIYPTIGASGAISGVFAGFVWAVIASARPGEAMIKPAVTSALFFLLINVGLAGLARAFDFAAIAWESHLGGFITGLILYPIFFRFKTSRARI